MAIHTYIHGNVKDSYFGYPNFVHTLALAYSRIPSVPNTASINVVFITINQKQIKPFFKISFHILFLKP